MSELQLSLIVIGALVVAGVLVYNRRQERAAQREAEGAFSAGHADVLMGAKGQAEDAMGRGGEARLRASLGEIVQDALPDPHLDYVIELTAVSGKEEPELREQWAALARRLRERLLFGVLPDGRYAAGLQLVSRAGVCGEADLIEFRSGVEAIASRLGLKVSAPEMKAALEAARAQDAFCAERDIQVALHVVSRQDGGFDRAAVLSAGKLHGLELDASGRLALRDASQRLLYELMDRSGARLDAGGAAAAPILALSLTMDLPRAPDTQRTFEAMVRLARALAAETGGAVVDDNGAALDDRALGAISAQLEQVRDELEARGLPPGGALALRLFS